MKDKKIKLIIPESWEEVTLEQYLQISNIETTSSVDRLVRIISTLTNEDYDDLIKMDRKTFMNISSKFGWVKQDIEDIKPVDKFVFNSREFIVKRTDFNELSVGEFISVETLIEENKDDKFGQLKSIASVIIREIIAGEEVEFNVHNLEEYADIYSQLPLRKALGIVMGFLSGENPYLDHTVDYSNPI